MLDDVVLGLICCGGSWFLRLAGRFQLLMLVFVLMATFLASLLVASLPGYPLWPGIQVRVMCVVGVRGFLLILVRVL